MKSINFLKKTAAALVIAAISFAGCDDKPENTDTPVITVAGDPPRTQTLEATQTSAGSITFTTTAAWTSTVKAGEETAAWLRISPASGDKAGEYTVSFALDANTSSEARTAIVTFTCGEMEAAFSITQKGTTVVSVTERKITFRVYGCEEQWSPDNGKEQHFLLGGVTVNIYKGTELVASPKTNAEGIAEVMLADGVYSYVAVNDSVVPWSNLHKRQPEDAAAPEIIGLYPDDIHIYERDGMLPGMLRYRDINGDGKTDGNDAVAQVELPVTEDAEQDVYVAPGDFAPLYATFSVALTSVQMPDPSATNDCKDLTEYAYMIDATLAHEYNALNTMNNYSGITSNEISLHRLWSEAYSMIINANTVLELLPAVTGTAGTDARTEANARYYRAYAYYTLLNYFGGVPVTSAIRTNTNAVETVSEARSTEAEVESLIITDCDYAAANYDGGGIGSRYAAMQLKTRILMRRGEYGAAGAVLQEIMLSGTFSLSHMWGVDNMAMELRNVFLPQAMRKGEPGSGYYGYCYPVRYAETLLLHAEASLATDNIMAAAQVANRFAITEGMMPVFPDGSATKEAVSTEITRLWNTQLNMEGHTFARLKRTGAFPGALAQYGAQEHHKVMPIPAEEIEKNPNLEQNVGY